MSDKQYFSGNNLRQAVLSAASQLGLEPDDVVYEELKKKGGTLKGRKRVVIVVRGDGTSTTAPSKPADSTAAPEPTPEPTSAPPEPAKAVEPVAVTGAVPVDAVQTQVTTPSPALDDDGGDDRDDDLADGDHEDGGLGDGGLEDGGIENGDSIDEDLSAPLFSASEDEEASSKPQAPVAVSPPRPAPPAAPQETASKQAAPKQAAPKRDSPKSAAPEEATGRFAKAADKALVPLLAVAGLDIEAAMFQSEERLEIDLSGRDQDLLTEEKGELLQAVEHLMPRLIRGVAGETTAVRVDCDGFHAAREEELRQLALRLAGEVKSSGTPHSTGPLEPSDRRIVHIAVEDDKEIVSRSDGRGFRKKVTLRPV